MKGLFLFSFSFLISLVSSRNVFHTQDIDTTTKRRVREEPILIPIKDPIDEDEGPIQILQYSALKKGPIDESPIEVLPLPKSKPNPISAKMLMMKAAENKVKPTPIGEGPPVEIIIPALPPKTKPTPLPFYRQMAFTTRDRHEHEHEDHHEHEHDEEDSNNVKPHPKPKPPAGAVPKEGPAPPSSKESPKSKPPPKPKPAPPASSYPEPPSAVVDPMPMPEPMPGYIPGYTGGLSEQNTINAEMNLIAMQQLTVEEREAARGAIQAVQNMCFADYYNYCQVMPMPIYMSPDSSSSSAGAASSAASPPCALKKRRMAAATSSKSPANLFMRVLNVAASLTTPSKGTRKTKSLFDDDYFSSGDDTSADYGYYGYYGNEYDDDDDAGSQGEYDDDSWFRKARRAIDASFSIITFYPVTEDDTTYGNTIVNDETPIYYNSVSNTNNNDYVTYLGYGAEGDDCLYRNWDSLSEECQEAISNVYTLRETYVKEEQDCPLAGILLMLLFLVLIIKGCRRMCCYSQQRERQENLAATLAALHADPEMKAKVEAMSGKPVPAIPQHKKCCFCRRIVRIVGIVMVSLVLVHIAGALTHAALGGDHDEDEHDEEHEEDEDDQKHPLIVATVFLSFLAAELMVIFLTLVVVKRYRTTAPSQSSQGIVASTGISPSNDNGSNNSSNGNSIIMLRPYWDRTVTFFQRFNIQQSTPEGYETLPLDESMHGSAAMTEMVSPSAPPHTTALRHIVVHQAAAPAVQVPTVMVVQPGAGPAQARSLSTVSLL